jgi:AAA domain, putative AbiEii toxin, Type IV TA system/AAA ATPase domain
MKLNTLTILNFRGIQRISVDFDKRANVIVGPNAVGKTTILEAIRLAKAILAPRIPDEAQNALVTLGAITPHNPQRLNYAAICGVETQPLNIVAVFELTAGEIANLDSLIHDLATAAVRASLGFSPAAGQLQIVQFLSTPEGAQALDRAKAAVVSALPNIKTSTLITLDLTIDPTSQTVRGANHLDQLIFASMESRLPPNQTLFSYFPADRALPVGETAIQVGGPDIAAQLQSHNAQAQTKYQRLKSTIINNELFGEKARDKQGEDFKKIFSQVLKDRELVGTTINQFGLVSIKIRQIPDGKVFDIDGMSSGEKGLILTFLLISNSIAEGGIILIDEPELHLNPAVCKLLLPFLIDEYLKPKNIQAIICSHSPEVLGAAFDRTDCSLHHLQSPTLISKIYAGDKQEVFDALKRLGTSASDVLFSNGSVFVEGEHDIEILETGFSKLLAKYNVTQLGGRDAIEREIKTLQDAEAKNAIDSLKCFIFDLDTMPTALKTTRLVKVLQWKRRCLENYLIDEKIIYDLLREEEVSSQPIQSRGEASLFFKELATSQLPAEIIRRVYESHKYDDPTFKPKSVTGRDYSDAAQILFDRLAVIHTQLHDLSRDKWCAEFVTKCGIEFSKEKAKWDAEWLELCDGKRFFKDLYSNPKIKMNIKPLKFKRLIIERMEREQRDGWVLVEKLVSDALRL